MGNPTLEWPPVALGGYKKQFAHVPTVMVIGEERPFLDHTNARALADFRNSISAEFLDD